MRTKVFLFSALAVAAMSSCNNEVSDCSTRENVNPIISTNMDAHSRADGFTEKTQFGSGDKMGLFLYKENAWGSAYYGDNNVNNLTTYNGTAWEILKPMYLNADKGTLWTYYPYDENVTDGTRIPVDITSNSTDYMYGKAQKSISVTYPYATIDMHHALSQFVIRLHPSGDYTLPGKVTKVKLDATSTIFYQEGTMDVTSGTISGLSGANKNNLEWSPANTQLISGQDADYKALVFPISFNSGVVTLTVTIDNADYTYEFTNTNWEKGKRYIYSFKMTANKLEIKPDPDGGGEYGDGGVKIEPWADDSNTDIELTPVN